MITLIFKENGEGQVYAIGYSTLDYSSSDKTEILKKVEEETLFKLSGPNWRENVNRIKLKDGDVVFDKTAGDI